MDSKGVVLILFLLQTAVVESFNSTWVRYIAQDNKVFPSPLATMVSADLHSCTKACHMTGNSLSLTYNSASSSCECYAADHSNDAGTESSNTVFVKTYDFVPITTTVATTTTVNPAANIPVSSGITPCKDLLANGNTADAVYAVTVGGRSFSVFCNMSAGGWTYLQQRYDGTLNFNRTYQEYVDGFGTPDGEHWLGLDNIYTMASTACVVQFDLLTVNDVWLHARYTSFSLGDAASKFLLSVTGHVAEVGLCTNTFMYNSGKVFSTYDNDGSSSCGASRGHGWWFGSCTYISINGAYTVTNTEAGFTEHCSGYNNLKASVMKIY